MLKSFSLKVLLLKGVYFMEIRCQYCGSKNVQVQIQSDKSFSVKKGVLGTLLFGKIGAVMGVNGKNKENKKYVCQACGMVSSKSMDVSKCQEISNALCSNNVSSLEILKLVYSNIEWSKSSIAKSKPHIESQDGSMLTTSQLLNRAYSFLKTQKWDKANECADQILDTRLDYPEAYFIKAMAHAKIPTKDNIHAHPEIRCSSWYEKALEKGKYSRHIAHDDDDFRQELRDLNNFLSKPNGIEIECLEIPDGVTIIQQDQFQEWTGIKKVIIPPSVKTIAQGAFYECTSLTEVIIPEGVTTIEDYAFYGCNLIEITVPSSVTSINDSAFETTIGIQKIYNNSDLNFTFGSMEHGSIAHDAKLIIDKNGSTNFDKIGEEYYEIFENNYVGNNTSIKDEQQIVLTTYLGHSETLTLPSHISGKKTSFCYFSSLAKIIVWPNDPEHSTTNYAAINLNECPFLKQFVIPKSVTKISAYLFCGSTKDMEIHYLGTQTEWLAIEKDERWNDALTKCIVQCSDGKLSIPPL